MPQSQVSVLAQDKQGYLWLATRAGLVRFNGLTFETFGKAQGLPSRNITALHTDRQGTLWVGTEEAGLFRYNGHRFRPYTQLLQATIHGITTDTQGQLWLATAKGVYTAAAGQLTRLTGFPEQPYTCISYTAGTLYAGSQNNGLYTHSNGQVWHYNTGNSRLPTNGVTALHSSPEAPDEVWIGTSAGPAVARGRHLFRLQLPGSLSNSHVTGFARDAYQNLWISLKVGGLLKYDGKDFAHLTRQNGLRTNRISSLTSDREGNIWIGTSGYGLQQYKAPWFVHFFDFERMSEPRITAISQDSTGTVWVGTDEGALARMKGLRPEWQQAPPWPEGTTLYSLLPSASGVWACTSNGLWQLHQGDWRYFGTQHGLPAADVYQALRIEDDQLYLATGAGMVHLQHDSLQLVPAPFAQLQVHSLHQDESGKVWAATKQGVFTLERGQLLPVPALQRLNLHDVTSITEDEQGNLYFAAYNQGFVMLRGTEAVLYSTSHGLPSNAIKNVYADQDQNLWLATNRDVLKVRLPQLRQYGRFSYRSYAGPGGFRGLEVCDNAMLQVRDGTIWFGTTKGLTQYLPHLDRRYSQYPKVLLSEVMLYSKPTDWQELGYPTDSTTGLPLRLRLPHTQNHISFNFHGICLSGPEAVRYKYRLLGYENGWSPATKRSFATYANLRPGDYTFELMARNHDGYWTPKPLTYTFSIMPPIWRREWFVGVLLLVIAGAVLSIVRLRERSLKQMNALLEQKVNLRTRMLERKNREKEILLQEIHHRVKNNLQIVISMLNLQARHVEDPTAVDVMRALRSRVRSMSILHERLYQHNDLEEIDLEEYFLGICEMLYAAYGISMGRVALELDIPPTKVDVDTAITLGLIVNELVSNTLKYAFPGGEQGLLHIALKQHDEVQYTLTVQDNGRGLPEDFYQKQQHNQSFGLKLVQSLSKKLDGSIRFYNNNGTKSILYFVLPS